MRTTGWSGTDTSRYFSASGSPSVPSGRFASSDAATASLRSSAVPSPSRSCVPPASRAVSPDRRRRRSAWRARRGGRAARRRGAPGRRVDGGRACARARHRGGARPSAAAAATPSGPPPSRVPSARSGSATVPVSTIAAGPRRRRGRAARAGRRGRRARSARSGSPATASRHGLRVDGEQAPRADGGAACGADRSARRSRRADHGHLVDREHRRRAQRRRSRPPSDGASADRERAQAPAGPQSGARSARATRPGSPRTGPILRIYARRESRCRRAARPRARARSPNCSRRAGARLGHQRHDVGRGGAAVVLDEVRVHAARCARRRSRSPSARTPRAAGRWCGRRAGS